MHEKTGRLALIDRILDHTNNRGRDAHELHSLRKKLEAMTFAELQAEENGVSHHL